MLRKVVAVEPPFQSKPCWKCSSPSSDLFCHCGALTEPPLSLNFFSLFGLTPSLLIDGESLRIRYYELSHKLHPDRFTQSLPPEPSFSARWSTHLNNAYKTLQDPDRRAEYLLSLYEVTSPTNPAPPFDLAERYFDLQDLLSEPGELSSLKSFEAEIKEKLKETESAWNQLGGQWEAGTQPNAQITENLKSLLVTRKFLKSMLRDIEEKKWQS